MPLAKQIAVIGDTTYDIDEFYESVKHRDGYPVLRRIRQEMRLGCATAVARMVESLHHTAILVTDTRYCCEKRRIIADGKVICRLDNDRAGVEPVHLPDADIVLIADYAKGVVTPELMRRIGERYAGKEIIVDWHPSRSADFYACATALQSAHSVLRPPGKILISTRGERGLSLHADHDSYNVPARPVEVIDPCGAGDMVLATLGVSRALGFSWKTACDVAADYAAQVCRVWGSVPAFHGPGPDELIREHH